MTYENSVYPKLNVLGTEKKNEPNASAEKLLGTLKKHGAPIYNNEQIRQPLDKRFGGHAA